MEKYIINQNLSDKEKYKYTLVIYLRSRTIRKVLGALFFPVILVLIFTGFAMGLNSGKHTSIIQWQIFIYPFAFISIIFLVPLIVIKIQKRRTVIYQLDEWGMSIDNNGKTSNIPWHEISTYSELSRCFLITQTNHDLNTHIIPKSEFKDINEERGFVEFLNQKRLKRK